MEKLKSDQLIETLSTLQQALQNWDHDSELEEKSEATEFRKKTHELLQKLKAQIDELEL